MVSMGYGKLEIWLETNTPSTVRNTVATNQLPDPTIPIQTKKIDYKIIVKRNIFSAVLDVKNKNLGKKIDQTPPAPTSLSLSLLGTIAGGEIKASRAIIQNTKTKAQDMYQIGDTIENGIIKVIERGKVILQVQGRQEVLLIKKDKKPSVQAADNKLKTRPTRQVRPTRPRSNNTRRVRIQPRRRLPATLNDTSLPMP